MSDGQYVRQCNQPRLPPQAAQIISVCIPSGFGMRLTGPGIYSSKLGQPQSLLNLSSEMYKGALHADISFFTEKAIIFTTEGAFVKKAFLSIKRSIATESPFI